MTSYKWPMGGAFIVSIPIKCKNFSSTMRIIRDVEHKLYVVKCVQANVVWTIKEISDVNQMR